MPNQVIEKTGREPNRIDRIVGDNLCRYRRANKMSQTALGEAVGVTYQQIQKYERGENRIGASRLWAFCEVLNMTPSDFFRGIRTDQLNDEQLNSNGLDLFMHPRGRALAQAFLKIGDDEIEKKIISVCKFWGQ